MSLTIKEVEHLANLAKIKLSQEEKEKYVKELSAILDFVRKLQKIKTDKLEEKIEGVGQLREDQVIGISSLEQETLLNLIPEKEDRLIKTKAVFE